jgi:retinol-binding protein 3
MIPAWLSCQSDSKNTEIEHSEKSYIIEWICVQLSNNYINAKTATEMNSYIRTQFSNGAYENYHASTQFLKQLSLDLQKISQDKHLRLLTNINIADTEIDITGKKISKDIDVQKRKNFQFREMRIHPGNVGYLRFDAFENPDYAGPTAIAAMNFLAYCDALIIDLRYNGGGHAAMSQLLLSYLFAKPVHYLTDYSRRNNKSTEWRTLPEVSGSRMPDVLVYVLTSNRFTFSAAEEFAFVIQNQKRGMIIGERTTGGGHKIDKFYLREYAIEFRIPTVRVADPVSNENWEVTGVEPDIQCKSSEAFDQAYAHALEELSDRTSGDQQDELEWLFEYQQALNEPMQMDSLALQSYTGTFGPVTVAIDNNQLKIKLDTDDKFKPIHALSNLQFIIEGDEKSRLEFEFNNDDKAVSLSGIRMDGTRATFDKAEKSAIIADRKSRKVSFNKDAKEDTTFLSQMGIEFIHIKGGDYNMGDVFDEGSRTEIPVHLVTVGDFNMSKTEVTFNQFDQFCQATGLNEPGDEGWGRGSRPVINITWSEAIRFCQWLSEKSGKFIDLPTEAEWEYATREKGRNVRFGNGQDIANPKDINFDCTESKKKPYSVPGVNVNMTLPVGSLSSNALGIYDMSGNVWEYCTDWYDKEYYRNCPVDNPAGPDNGRYRVIRGGGFGTGPAWIRTVTRAAWSPNTRDNQTGFRLVILE